MKKLMLLISVVFHPLVMAAYMAAILALYLPEAYGPFTQEMVWRLVIAFALLTALFPAITVLGMWLFTPFVTDLELTDRKERIGPFLVLIIYYICTAKFLVFDLNLGIIVQVLLFSTTAMIGLMVLINFRFKISIHAAAIWALAGSALGLAWNFPDSQLIYAAYASIIAGGLVGTSRLFLGYHRPDEVWVGSAFGFLHSLGAVLVFL